MSTSFLYHNFGIKGYHYVNTRYANGETILKIRHAPFSLCCPECGKKNIIRRGTVTRSFRTIPIGKRVVKIVLAVQRVFCRACKIVRQVKVSFAEKQRSFTKAFENYALELCRHMTIKGVANHLGVSWDTVKDIQKRYLHRHFSRPKLGKLVHIAIDEISIGKGHRYLTIVLDLESGKVVFVGDGKGKDALIPFWKRLRRSKAKIEAVAIDMSPAYFSAVMDNLEDAAIVFDRFHMVKLFNEKLSDFRRKLYHLISSVEEKNILKGLRWLLLKKSENLDESKNESQRLEDALELNKPLSIVYYMKEDLGQLWSQKNKDTAKEFLEDWIKRAMDTKIRMLQKFAMLLSAFRTGVLNWYDYPISTGPLEGTNNKIKTMKRQAYGFRDLEFFKLKIKALHMTKYALVG